MTGNRAAPIRRPAIGQSEIAYGQSGSAGMPNGERVLHRFITRRLEPLQGEALAEGQGSSGGLAATCDEPLPAVGNRAFLFVLFSRELILLY